MNFPLNPSWTSCLDWLCVGIQTATAAVSSRVQWPCCAQRFIALLSMLWLLHYFCSYSMMSPEPVERVIHISTYGQAFSSRLLSILCPVMSSWVTPVYTQAQWSFFDQGWEQRCGSLNRNAPMDSCVWVPVTTGCGTITCSTPPSSLDLHPIIHPF